MFSLPGTRRLTKQKVLSETTAPLPVALERSDQPPQVPSIDHAPRTVCIIGTDNGMGLSRDREIFAIAFRSAGWDVVFANPQDRSAVVSCAVNLHSEVVTSRFLGSAPINIIVPNPEWWQMEWNPILLRPSVRVWAKTLDAERIFSRNGASVQYVGFRSLDRRDSAVRRVPVFLHVGGKSPNKGTDTLIANWQAEWPQLIVVTTQPMRTSLRNVTILRRRTLDAEIRKLQNECAFHIYPSQYEGFGHAQWEGLSCGAIVFATNGPPFAEQAQAFRLLDARPIKGKVVTKHAVMPQAIVTAVRWVKALTPAEIAEHGAAARLAWEQNTANFEQRIHELIPALDDPPSVAIHPISAVAKAQYPTNGEIPGFAYVGRVDCVTGQGTAARHQLHVLRKHGLRFQIIDAGSCASPDPKGMDPFVRAARQSDMGITPRGTIIHLQPNTAEKFHRDRSLPRPHILVSVWETSRLPVSWVPLINSYDQVWCATEWQRRVYSASGVKEELLRVVPFAIDPTLYDLQPRRRNGDGKTIFGSVFQWTERKDPEALISAFLHEFSADCRAVLVLKSYEGDNPSTSVRSKVDAIVKSFHLPGKPPEIRVVSSALDGSGMAEFYRSIDCCVSSHRGEGFGFQIAEALLYGRPVIATGWSAPAEYADGCFRPVRYTLEPPHRNEWQPFYTADQLWARVDVSDLAAAMREAHQRQIALPLDLFRERCLSLTKQAGDAAYECLREIIR